MRIVKSNVFVDFNPRSPHRERRRHIQPELETTLFQSTLPSQGATYNDDETSRINFISIHAPLTGSDTTPEIDAELDVISIHAPLTGSD